MKAIQIISQDIFDKIRSRFENLEMGDETGAVTIDPAEARFFDFDFIYEGNNFGRVSISLNDLGSLKVYYSQGITENIDEPAKQVWYKFLKEMRMFAMRRLLRFDTRDIAKTNLDKNDFQYLANKGTKDEPMSTTMNESRWNSKNSKKTSRAVTGTTEVIVRHARPVDEMYPGSRSQRKNIKAIFIQNKDGERFKYPFIHPAGAFAMAQHIDHGGVPHDPAGKAIMRMSEQIAQLQEFSRHVQRSQLHDDAMGIAQRAGQRLTELKAMIEALSKRHHYESWIAEFNEQEMIDDNLMELDPVTMEDYKSKFTQTNFQEELAKFFPLIHKIMQETNSINLESYVQESEDNQLTLNGKLVEPSSLEIDGVDTKDHPDYSDAYFSYAEFMDGTPLTDEELDQLRDEHGDLLNQMAHDSMYEGKKDQSHVDEFSQFEAWAEAVEQGKLTDDQIEELKNALGELSEPLKLGPDGSIAAQFFQQFGLDDSDLADKFKSAADLDPTTDPMIILQLWAKESYPELLVALGMSDTSQEQEPTQQDTEPEEPQSTENTEMVMPPGVMESRDRKAIVQEVAKIVKQFYNRDNPEVGPFRGNEGIAIDVEKKISEMFGEEAGQQARELAEKFMEKLTMEWQERHGKTLGVADDGLARLKELLGNIKQKVEGIGDQGHGGKDFNVNIMSAEDSEQDMEKNKIQLIPGKFYVVGKAYGRLKSVAGPFDDEGEAEIEKAEYSGGGKRDAAVAQWTGRAWNFDYTDSEQGVAEGYREYDELRDRIDHILIKAYNKYGTRDEIIDAAKPAAMKAARELGAEKYFDEVWMNALASHDVDTDFGDNDDDFDYTDYSMRKGERGMAEGSGNTVDFPIANVRRPNGAIGTQGVTTDQVAGVLKNVTGLDVSPDMSMKELVDTLRGNAQAQQQLRQFTKQNPVKIQELPDGTYHIQDGHHRTFLLNLLGDKTVPALVNGGQQGVAEGWELNRILKIAGLAK